MAHFYASIQGNRSEATRMGTPNSGIYGHVRGWDIGARVDCAVDTDGNDIVTVRITRGSNRYGSGLVLGQFKIHEDEIIRVDE